MLIIVLIMYVKPLFYLLTPVLYSFERVASPASDFYLLNNLLLLFHVAFSFVALSLGPWLFNTSLRARRPDIHKKIGKFYITGCMAGAVTVFPLALSNATGTVAHLGFGVMSVVWFTLAYLAYGAAVNRDFIAHRRWAVRSFAVTFAFVHVGLSYKLFIPSGTFNAQGMQALQSMVSWLGNLLFAEIYLMSTRLNGQFKGFTRDWRLFYNPKDKVYLKVNKP